MGESLLSFDPGIPFGWSFWPREAKPCSIPKYAGIFDVDAPFRGGAAWLKKNEEMAGEIEHMIDLYMPDAVCSEFPTYRPDPKGDVTATSGSLIKLTINFACIVQICRYKKTRFIPVRPIDWMGQLDDVKIRMFVERRIGPLDELVRHIQPSKRTHAIDSIGMGLYVRTGRL